MDSTTLIAKIRSLGREPKHWIAPGLLAAMLVAPGLWSALTTFNTNASSLPSAGPAGAMGDMPGGAPRARMLDGGPMPSPANMQGNAPGAGAGYGHTDLDAEKSSVGIMESLPESFG